MPKGPNGEKRPTDVVSCAVTVGRIAIGELEDTRHKHPGRSKAGKAGGNARAKARM